MGRWKEESFEENFTRNNSFCASVVIDDIDQNPFLTGREAEEGFAVRSMAGTTIYLRAENSDQKKEWIDSITMSLYRRNGKYIKG